MTDSLRPVDVIVPVYNAVDAVERCLESVLANTADEPDIRIVVADDASPDPQISALLSRFNQDYSRLVIRRRPNNIGFPANCNESMLEAVGDVVLLNSDTIVPVGWLGPLRRLAHSSARVGSVTPLTTNGEICSVPVWLQPNSYPSHFTVDELHDVAKAVGYGDWIEIPTGVGFCQYFTRPGLDAVGLFDTELFGRGYGEENDLCLRLRHNGYVNLLCDTVFVHHEGGLSFGESTPERLRENLAKLNRRWPGYDDLIAHFIADNPLAGVQARFGFELLRRSKPSSSLRILQVLHNPIRSGHIGGTEFHVEDLTSASRGDNPVLSAIENEPVVQHGEITRWRPFPVAARTGAGLDWIDPLLNTGIDVIHVHHLAGLGFNRMSALLDAAVQRGIPAVYSTHDFFAICPGIQLRDAESGEPCQAGTGGSCPGCDAASTVAIGGPSDVWRSQWRRLLADLTIVAPSQAAADGHQAVWGPVGDLEIIPHGTNGHRIDRSRVEPSGPIRFAVVGYGGAHKGDEELAAIIDRLSGSGVEWHFFGRTEPADEAARPGEGNAVYHGHYRRHEIVDLLAGNSLTAALSLPNWPETYSYTLSEAWQAGLFVFASEQGAIAERIAQTGAGVVFPSRDPDERAELILETLQSSEATRRLTEAARNAARALPTVPQMGEAYDRLYRRLAGRDSRPAKSALRYRWTGTEKSSMVGTFRSPLPVETSTSEPVATLFRRPGFDQ